MKRTGRTKISALGRGKACWLCMMCPRYILIGSLRQNTQNDPRSHPDVAARCLQHVILHSAHLSCRALSSSCACTISCLSYSLPAQHCNCRGLCEKSQALVGIKKFSPLAHPDL